MNVGNGCANADTGKTFELPDLGNPACPECSQTNVIPVKLPVSATSKAALAVGVTAMIALVVVATYYGVRVLRQPTKTPTPVTRDVAHVRVNVESGTPAGPARSVSSKPLASGIPLGAMADYNQAAIELEAAVLRQPTDSWAHANLCTAYLRLERRADALASCKRAIRSDKKNWLAHYNMASIRLLGGQTSDAIEELRQALALVDPSAPGPMTRTELVRQMKVDTDLNGLHGDPAFIKLTAIQ